MGKATLVTAEDLAAKYPVDRTHDAALKAWRAFLYNFRTDDGPTLIENKHYIIRYTVWPNIIAYSDKAIARLLLLKAKKHPLAAQVVEQHRAKLCQVLGIETSTNASANADDNSLTSS